MTAELKMCIRDRSWILCHRSGGFYRRALFFQDPGGRPSGQLRHGAVPVSYTHLDVYKRQILKFDSLKFQKLEDTIEAIGVDRCKLCTYCWDGKE